MFKFLWKILTFLFHVSTTLALIAIVFIFSGLYQVNSFKSVAGNSTAPDLKALQLENKYSKGVKMPSGEVRALPDFPGRSIQMNKDQKTLFKLNLALAPVDVPPLLLAIENQLEIGIYVQTACGSASCALYQPRGFLKDKYRIEYYGPHFNADLSGRYVMMHEVGHILQYSYIDKAEFDRFFVEFKKSPIWQECYAQPAALTLHGEVKEGKSCVNKREIFAEQFAYWATGQLYSYDPDKKSFAPMATGYQVPMLLSDQEFARLFAQFTSN